MTKQIDDLMVLAWAMANALSIGAKTRAESELRTALEAALKPGEVVAHINSNGVVHAAGYPWSDSELLTPLVAAPPAQTPDAKSEYEADVWHEGSQSFYRAKLLHKLTPEEVDAAPPAQTPVPHGYWVVNSTPEALKMWPATEDLLLEIAAQSTTQKPVEPMRKYVEDFAAKGGWTKDSGEGAFDFVQRISYAQGVEDGRNRPSQTPLEQNQKPIRVFGWVWKDKRHEDGCSYVPSYTPAQHVQNGELFALVDPVDLHDPLANTSWSSPN